MIIDEAATLSDEFFFMATEFTSVRLPAEFSMQFAFNVVINDNDDGPFQRMPTKLT
jgi:hypothetical protein